MGERLLRLPAVLERVPIGKTALHERYIRTGKLKKINLGRRSVAFAESNVDQIVAEIIAGSDSVKKVAMTPNLPEHRAARKKKPKSKRRR